MIQLPERFLEQMKEQLQDEYDDYIKSYDEERVYGLRVNTSKISVEDFLQISPFHLTPIPWIENGFYYEGSDKPAKHPYYFAGLYYLQEPSAMTPANRLPIEPGDRVLDVCAAPGGKSTELAVKLQHEGVLISNDISNSRAKALLKNLELFGIDNSIIMSEVPNKLESHFPEYFDKILIDAPCSGEGMFRKEPSVIKSWLEHGNEYFAKIQKGILESAYHMLKPGGLLLYSTCTFATMEDEDSVLHFLEDHPNMKVIPMESYEGFGSCMPEYTKIREDMRHCVRIWPHKMKGEGHFVALMEKEGERIPNRRKSSGKAPDWDKDMQEFFSLVSFPIDKNRLEIRKEKVYYLPEEAEHLEGLRILRSGLLLGECLKNRFEPSQAFAMTLKPEQFKNVISLSPDDERVIRYLKGETLDISDFQDGKRKGWQLVCVDRFPLGFGKAAGNSLKNKYLAGWRWQ